MKKKKNFRKRIVHFAVKCIALAAVILVGVCMKSPQEVQAATE